MTVKTCAGTGSKEGKQCKMQAVAEEAKAMRTGARGRLARAVKDSERREVYGETADGERRAAQKRPGAGLPLHVHEPSRLPRWPCTLYGFICSAEAVVMMLAAL